MSQKPAGSSLTVLGGALDGTVFRLAEAGELLVGSDARCGLRLMLPGVASIHARLRLGPGQATAEASSGTSGLYVNDELVAGNRTLRHGDILWLGPPGGEQSVMLQCRLVAPPAARAAAPAPAPAPAPSADSEFDVVEPGASPFFVEAAPAAAPTTEDAFLVLEPAAPAAPAPPPPADDFLVLEPTAPAPQAVAPPAPARPAARPPAAEAPPDLGPAPGPSDAVFEVPEPEGAVFEVPAPELARAPVPPPTPAAAPRPRPVAPSAPEPTAAPRPRRTDRPSGAHRVPVAAPPAATRRGAGGGRGLLLAGLGLLALIVVAGGVFVARKWSGTPQLQAVQPPRARAGQTVVLTGSHFAAAREANTVRFGRHSGRVLKAEPGRLEVVVPDIDLAPGADARVPVVVEVAGRASQAVEATIYQGPRLHGLLPDVAVPGETVELRGAGWTNGAVVRFGEREAEILDLRPDAIRVRVPEIPGPPGTEAPVTVVMGDAASNPGPFFVGRLPLIIRIEPAAAAPGEVVTVTGKGFPAQPGAVVVRLGARPALLLSAAEASLRLVVPRLEPGVTPLQVELPATGQANQADFDVTGTPADPVDFQFVAEPLDGHPTRAVLTTALGPAFVFSAAGGQAAATRALEAQKRLNAAAGPLKAALEADLEARDFASGRPVIALKGQATSLFEVTPEDAAGYDLDWTGLGARHKPVTPGRLAAWWVAVARDLVLVLLRNEKPQHAAALAPEGRVLAELQAAARKQSHWGVPRALVAEAKPPLLAGLRLLGLRVPPSVPEPAGSPAAAQASAAEQALQAFKLEGEWRGRETVPEGSRYITLFFQGKTGTFELASGPGVGFPLTQLEQPQKGVVRFSIFVGGGPRTYSGRFDGQKLSGTISAGPGGPGLGTFELVPR